MSQVQDTGLALVRDPSEALAAQGAFRRARKRVLEFQKDAETPDYLMAYAHKRQDEALARIERLDPIWAKMLRDAYGV